MERGGGEAREEAEKMKRVRMAYTVEMGTLIYRNQCLERGPPTL